MSSKDEAHRGTAEAALARAELYDTLGQLRDRLNYAQRVDDALDRAKVRVQAARRRNPVGFAAGVVAAAALTGTVVWGVARGVAKRLG
ncbi:DUF3618 domain-containing protein [Leucobacter sp. CSA1]|uniref:DUF3618 domain-containing protein n=1 Tax=Leucobacter chromiisoli TaxID=2796471 RepID=A0A934Q4Y1_9MICO|nr:DUF3618 domain-containing protein [Leucobacter chromiisoli]MBK0417505.1 DUF3618 domain-containing protein [Leucobacter chromiisoli]